VEEENTLVEMGEREKEGGGGERERVRESEGKRIMIETSKE
jgi:hypothetical protein